MRSLDHFAHAVRDLDQAGRAFERMGFRLGRTYYEIVADLDKSIPLLRDKMMPRFQCGDGMAIVSLTSDDLPGDRAAIEALGLVADPIINARRKVPMPDGSTDETKQPLLLRLAGRVPPLPHLVSVAPLQAGNDLRPGVAAAPERGARCREPDLRGRAPCRSGRLFRGDV